MPLNRCCLLNVDYLLFAERYAWNEWNYTRSFDSCVMDEKLCDAEYYGVQQVDVEECKCQQQLHGTKQSCRAESFLQKLTSELQAHHKEQRIKVSVNQSFCQVRYAF